MTRSAFWLVLDEMAEVASIVLPMTHIAAPRDTERVRDSRSETYPANKDEIHAEMRMMETTRPWSVGVKSPKLAINWGITVTGAIDPVSKLDNDRD